MLQSDLGHAILGARQDRIANLYRTAALTVLKPEPSKRARNAVLGNATTFPETWVQACQPRPNSEFLADR